MDDVLEIMDDVDVGMAYRKLAVRIILEGALDKDVEFLRSRWCADLCIWCGFAFDGRDIERAMKVNGLWLMERGEIRRALHDFLYDEIPIEESVREWWEELCEERESEAVAVG